MSFNVLTSKFVGLRQGYANNLPQVVDYDQSHSAIELAPFWVDISRDVEQKTKEIEGLIDELHDLHKSRLMVRFDDSVDHVRDLEIDQLTSDITKRFSHIKDLLKQIQGEDGDKEDALCKNIQRTHAARLQELSLAFRKSQKTYMSRVKQQKEGGGGVFPDGDDADDADGDQNDEEERFESGLLLVSGESKLDRKDLQRRDEEIVKIAKSIEELAVIFRELGQLVVEQGSILDRIEYNVDLVVEKVKKGNEELVKTSQVQNTQRPVKCILVLVLIIFVLLLILAFKHSV